MMLENKNEEFDLKVREMLADAEEKAPRGVWKAVSGRLAGAPAPAGRKVVPFWYALAGAAAAVLVGLGLFLPHTSGTIGEDGIALVENTTETPLLARVVEPDTAFEEIADERHPAARRVVERCNSEAQSPAVPADEYVPAPAAAAETADNEELPATAATAEEKSASPQTAAGSGKAAPEIDPFALMEWEDARDAAQEKETSLTVQGALGGNDSNFSINGRNYFSPGSSSVSTTGIHEESASAYGIPFTLGVGIRKYLTERFSIASGINCSIVTRTFDGTYNEVNAGTLTRSLSGDIFHSMHFIGIPVAAYYDIVSTDRTKFHAFVSGQAEYCVSNSYTVRSGSEQQIFRDRAKGIQWSAGAGIGVEFGITDALGIYLDPGVRYYFHYSGQPKSVRSEKPFMINIEAGLRFKL